MSDVPVEAWPTGYPYPFRPFARGGRLIGSQGSVTLLSGDGTRTSVAVPTEAVDALWLRGAAADPDSAGLVLLRDAGGWPVAVINVDEWLPERSLINDVDEIWRRSRLPDVLATAGLPVRRVSRAPDARRGARDGWSPDTLRRACSLSAIRLWPWWILPLRLVLLFSFGALLIGSAITEDLGATAATAMTLLLTSVLLCEVIPVGLDVIRDRRSRPVTDEWEPLPAVPVRRAFRRTARVRRTTDAVAVVTSEDIERWLPRAGPGAVVSLACLPTRSGETFVLLLDDEHRVRAALPASSWTAGRADGLARLAEFLNVPVVPAGPPRVPLYSDEAMFDGRRAPQFSNGVLMFNPADPVAVFSPILVLVSTAPQAEAPTWVVVLAVSLLIGSWGRGLIRAGARRWWSAFVEPVSHPSAPSTERSQM